MPNTKEVTKQLKKMLSKAKGKLLRNLQQAELIDKRIQDSTERYRNYHMTSLLRF